MRKLVRLAVAGLVVGAVAAAGLVGTSSSAGAQPIGYVIVEGLEEEGCTLHRIDLATGVVDAAIGAPADENCVSDLAFSPDSNTLYGLLSTNDDGGAVFLVTFDLATGQASTFDQIGDFNAFATDGGLAFDSTGILYATFAPSDPDATAPNCQISVAYCTYRVDPANPGAALFIGQTTALAETDVGPFAGACDGGFVGSEDVFVDDDDGFGGDEPAADTAEEPTTTSAPEAVEEELDEPAGISEDFLTNVNRGTGLGTPVALPFGHFVPGFDFDLPGTLWGVGITIGGPPSVFTIDRSTGVATPTATITGLSGVEEAVALAIPKSCLPELTFTG
jgi:hypothetical protein